MRSRPSTLRPTPKPTTKAATTEHEPGTGPVRTCVGCRRRAPWATLVRITRVDGAVAVDGSSGGRGAWLCRDASAGGGVDAGCLAAALGRGGFERAWRMSLGTEERQAIERLAQPAADGGERPNAP